MTRSSKVLVVLSVFTLGMLGTWGCARKPVGRNSAQERIQALEGRCVQLEHDYRTVASTRDQARKQVAALEEENARLHKELAAYQAVVKERDELTRQVKERDELSRQVKAGQVEAAGLRKQLAELTGERNTLASRVADRTSERDGLQTRVDRIKKGLHTLLSAEEAPAPVATMPPASDSVPAPAPTPTGANTAAPAGPPLGAE